MHFNLNIGLLSSDARIIVLLVTRAILMGLMGEHVAKQRQPQRPTASYTKRRNSMCCVCAGARVGGVELRLLGGKSEKFAKSENRAPLSFLPIKPAPYSVNGLFVNGLGFVRRKRGFPSPEPGSGQAHTSAERQEARTASGGATLVSTLS